MLRKFRTQTSRSSGLWKAVSKLGLIEAGNFPAAIKTVAEWFPKKERALATGIFNSGANVGAVVAPIMVPWILGVYGWEQAFIITGAIGFVWLIFWLLLYEIPKKQKRLGQAELAPPLTWILAGPASRWRSSTPLPPMALLIFMLQYLNHTLNSIKIIYIRQIFSRNDIDGHKLRSRHFLAQQKVAV